MVNIFETLLATGETILLDGATGTVLMGMGLTQGAPPEAWNRLYPERITAMHAGYIEAGSQVVLTNSFGGSRFRLKLHNFQDQVYELNKLAAENARRAADAVSHPVAVGGSIGPSGELFVPMGEMTFEAAVAAFAEQAQGLADGGVDLFWIETMSDLQEVEAAVQGVRQVSDLPVCATMTFDTRGHTMMGVSPQQAYEALKGWKLAAIGANCGNGPDEIEAVIYAMHQLDPEMALIAKSNAGIPQWLNNTLSYNGTPEVMALYAQRVRSLGARLIGGCCGNDTGHIHQMKLALQQAPLQIEMAPRGYQVEASDSGSQRERRRRRDR